MTAVTPELDALLRSVVTNPDDDTPRLLYADALDELPTARVKCPACVIPGRIPRRQPWVLHAACETCDGTGEVVDTFPAERAELIRVQVRIARMNDTDPRTQAISVEDWDQFNNDRKRQTFLLQLMKERGLLTGREFYRRGFVESWTGTAEEWLKVEGALFWHPDQREQRIEKCKDCDGDGWQYHDNNGRGSRTKCSNPLCSKGDIKFADVPRPCPPSAHPLRKVTLTSLGSDPDGLLIGKDSSVTHTEGHSIWTSSNWPGLPFELVPEEEWYEHDSEYE